MSVAELFYPNSYDLQMNNCIVNGELILVNPPATDKLHASSSENSSGTASGALTVVGGAGIGFDVNIGGKLKTIGNVECAGLNVGSSSILDSSGAISINAGITYISNTIDATSEDSASLSVKGGVFIGKNIIAVGGTGSSAYDEGTIVIAGGLGVAENVNVQHDIKGGDLFSDNNVTTTNNLIGNGLISNGGASVALPILCPLTFLNVSGSTQSPFSYYEDISLSFPVAGAIISTLDTRFIRIGNTVTIIFYRMYGTPQTAGTIFTNQNAIPARFLGDYFAYQIIIVTNNNTRGAGLVEVRGNDGTADVGRIVFYSTPSMIDFSGSGTQIVVWGSSITYTIL